MTAELPRRAMVFLRRAYLLAGMLAIIAGILGMHIMTGTHAMPASAAVPDTEMVMVAPASAATAPTPVARVVEGKPAAQAMTSMPGLSCADAGGCASMSTMGTSCIPSPGNPPPVVPPPGVTPFAAIVPAPLPTGLAAYPYLPGSPSPGELCISRT